MEADDWALPTVATPHPAGPAASAPPGDEWALPAPSPVALQVRNNLTAVFGTNPDQEATLRRAALATETPLQTARNLPDVVQQQAAQRGFDAEVLARRFPRTADLMTNQDYARLAHDDIPKVSNVEQHIEALAAPPAETRTPQPTVGGSWISTLGDAAGDAAKYLFSADGKGLAYDAGSLVKGLGGSFNTAAKGASLVAAPLPMLYDAIVGGTKAQDAYFKATTAQADSDSSAFEVGKDATFGAKAFHAVGGLLGTLSQITLSGAGGAPAVVRAGASATEAAMALAEHGVKAMAFPATSDAINVGKQVYEQTGDAGKAARAAIAQWGSSSAMGVVPLSVAGGLATRITTGAVSGMASGEASRQWMNSFLPQGMQAQFDPEQTILSGLTGAMMAGVMGPHAETTATRPELMQAFRDADAADQSLRGANVLHGLAEAASTSKLRERDPAVFKQFVADAAEDGPVQAVYVDAKQLAEALHQSGIGTDEMGAKLPGLQGQLEEALATGGQVRIPIEDFATHIAGGPLQEGLMPHLRTDPLGMTFDEGKAFAQTQGEHMQAAVARITAAREADAVHQTSRDQVFETVRGQLEATGRFTPDVNNAYAALHRDFYTTMAEREGVLPHELFDQHPVRIGAERPAGDALAQSPRAFYDPASKTIAILKDADLSSFLHESGHHFLDTLSIMAARPDAPAGIKGDMAALLKQWNVADLDTWHAMPLDAQRAGHENFATSFERYLLEGKAPSFELRTLFGKFRSWLLSVYQSLRGLNAELSPEVRGVFDRMLASDSAIADAERARAYMPLFDSPEAAAKAGVTPEEWQRYQALGHDATAEAMAGLSSKTMRDLAWSDNVRSRALKDLARDAAEKRKAVRREVEGEVDQQPVYAAQRFIRHGEITTDNRSNAKRKILENASMGSTKLDLPALKAMYGDGPAAPWRYLRVGGEYGDVIKEHGLHPDIVAELFGFQSGDAMVRSLLDAPKRSDVVAGLTEQRMLERHGEIATPQALATAADDAVHNRIRTRFIATEMKALTKAVGSARDIARAAQETADRVIAGKVIREVNDRQHMAAETRAGKEATKRLTTGDIDGAALAKRDQLLNNALARSARDAQVDVQKGLTYLKRFDRDAVRSKIDVDIREQIDSLLERYDLRKAPPEGPTRAQTSLAEWLASQQAAGMSPSISVNILQGVPATHYRDMRVEQFRGLADAVKALEHVGRERRTLTVQGKRVDLDQYVADRLVPKLAERGVRFTKDQLVERADLREKNEVGILLDHFKSWLRSAAAQLKPQEFKRNQYDRHELSGPFGEAIFDPVIDANYRKTRMLKELSDDFGRAAEGLGRKWQDSLREQVAHDTLVDPDRTEPGAAPVMMRMTRGRMLGIAIHVGNESNFGKLTKGWGWKGEDVWRLLNEHMTADDWKATQTVWDLYEKHWPDLEAMNRRLGNTMPEKIEPRAFETKFGRQRGGYAAIAYDHLRSRRGEREAAMQAIDPAHGLFGRDYFRADTTTNGSMNSRVEGYNDRVELDYHSIAPRLRETIHDLAYRETLIDVNKVLEHPDFRKSFKQAYGPEAYQSMREWIANLANGNTIDAQVSALGKFWRYTRTGMVINAIAFRATTVLKHGGSAGIKTTGYFLGGGEKFLASRFAAMGTDYSSQIAGARAKFGEINNRLLQQDRDFQATANTLFEPDTKLAKAHRFGHAAVAWSDMMTAVPTAWAAYDRAITEGIPKTQGGTGAPMSEAQAVSYANKIVREAHGSTAEAARAMVLSQRSEAMKMFTTLYGFMNNSYGQQLDGFDKLHTAGISNTPVLARTFMAIIVPAIWAHYLTHGAAKTDEDESWAGWVSKAIAGEVAASVPYVRDVVSMVQGYKSAGMVPAENWLATMVNAAKQVSADAGTGKPIKAIADAAGMGLHIPGMGQLGQTVQYEYDVRHGKESPQTNAEHAKGLVTGHGDHH